MISIFDADTYTIPVTHKISTFIREYDIAKANINILLLKGYITEEKYIELYNAPKKVREKTVGLMQLKDKALSNALMSGFGEARKLFYEANNIKEYEILSVKKDAIFLIDRVANVTKFGNIEFKMKNEFTSFYNFPNLEIYYKNFGGVEKIDVKGMGDSQLSLHNRYFLDLLLCIFSAAEQEPALEVVNLIRSISDSYINHELSIDYYREFNNRSFYRTFFMFDGERAFLRDINQHVQVTDIDPAYNYGLLQILYKIFLDKYLASMRF